MFESADSMNFITIVGDAEFRFGFCLFVFLANNRNTLQRQFEC